jgi:hypothetical protein
MMALGGSDTEMGRQNIDDICWWTHSNASSMRDKKVVCTEAPS